MAGCKSTYFSKKDVRSAQKLVGLEFENKYLDTLYPYLIRNRIGYDTLRSRSLPIQIAPAIYFNPHPANFSIPRGDDASIPMDFNSLDRPANDVDLAFLSIQELASLMRSDQLSSVELTQLYLDRLKKYNGILKCAITITEQLALNQAARADEELGKGIDRGWLHGIPYGVKDLASVKNYPTTWGAFPYKDQIIDEDAAVVEELEKAGAVLIAKLSSGALARGDVWFGGQTVSPWDTTMGASGSSAGSASATAAGLVAFSIGTETLGSITSPSNRNGCSGYRPTFGRVSREGIMTLSWSMDKVGPICRSAMDCSLVFDVLEDRPEPRYPEEVPFRFKEDLDVRTLKVGYLHELVEKDTTEIKQNILKAMKVLVQKGLQVDTLSLPDSFPFAAFDIILRAESGAFFDELVRSGGVNSMVQQGQRSRANSLRQSRFIPAVEYIQANRFRSELIEEINRLFSDYDVIISPTFGGRQLLITNLTGHPVVTVPTGLDKKGHPTSISFIGNLYDDDLVLSFAHAFQKLTDFHGARPPLFGSAQ